MAGAKEIRTKIKSIKSTQKITRAMEMVAASKMRKVQQRMMATRPYAEKIAEVIIHLSKAQAEYQHTYLEQREIKTVGLIVVSTDRGLCGGLNANLFRKLLAQISEWEEKGFAVKVAVIGSKAAAFFKNLNVEIVASSSKLSEKPTVWELIGTVKVMLDGFESKNIDAVYVAYNEFVNTMSQEPVTKQLLPVVAPEKTDEEKSHYWDYIYEPDSKSLLDKLLERYIESMVYQSVVENAACEQAARMVAMKSASDNAGDLIDSFQLAYNKARQAAITQELSEIVSGAAAV